MNCSKMTCKVALLSLCFYSVSTAHSLKINEVINTLKFPHLYNSHANSSLIKIHQTSRNPENKSSHFENEGSVTRVKLLNKNGYRHTRDLRPIEFEINGEKAKLNLVLSGRKTFSSSAPIWLVRSHQAIGSNHAYELLKNRQDILDGDFYVDKQNKAVILVRHDRKKNTMMYDGIFGEGSRRRIIRSLPENPKVRLKRTIGTKYNKHIIYALPEIDEYTDSIFDSQEIILERNGILLDKLDVPLETLYPKLLIVVDYHLFKLLGKDVPRTVRYIATFWNVVDQKYESLKTPKVEVIVTGIIIAKDERALNFIYWSHNETEKADIERLMERARSYFSRYFFNDTGFENYNAVVVMTGLQMNLMEGYFDINGLAARLGGICSGEHNVAIVTDDGVYRNTLVAIHELGHLLNLSHDYADECSGISYLFDPLNTSVMSSATNGSDIFWSDCSLRLLKEFSTLKAAKCLATRN